MNTVFTFDTLVKDHTPLIREIKTRMGEHRFMHTLAVAKESFRLSKEFSLSQKDTKRLFVAALLHDVTKALNFEEQCAIAKKLNIPLTDEDLASPPILHSLTGAVVAEQDFAPYTDPDIAEAIRCHTVGKADMTLFDKLLFVADYIEETRSHPICQETRKNFYESLSSGNDKEDTLDRFIVLISNNTIKHVEAEGRAIHSNTKKTIEALSKKG